MMSIETMRSVDPRTVDRSTLVQREQHPARAFGSAERTGCGTFIQQIKNPYCYLDGKTVVKISFAKTDTTYGGLSGTLSERALIMNKLNLFARFYGQAIEPVIQSEVRSKKEYTD